MRIPTVPKVENMESPRTGNPVANQFIITTKEGRYFQSYKTVIAFIPNRRAYDDTCEVAHAKTILDVNAWDYSVTTSKYRRIFLGEGIEDTRRKIDSGEYEMEDLNA